VGRQADARIDDQRSFGEMRSQRTQAEHVVKPLAGTDRRAPRHQHPAPSFDQSLGDNEVLGCVGEHLEALGGQDTRRLDKAKHVGLQRIRFADHLELDPGRGEHFARHLRRRHRLFHAVTAGGVRQNSSADVADEPPEVLPLLEAHGLAP
jgi:hypothetical protein